MSQLISENIESEFINLFFSKKFNELESRLIPILQKNPTWLNGWKILSDTYLIQGKDAKYPAQKALALNHYDPKEYCYYGLILKAEGDLQGAAQAFSQAIQLNPNDAAAHNNLGIVKKDLGDFEAGIAYYQQALKINPNYSDCFSNLLFCLSHYDGVDAKTLYQAHIDYSEVYEKPMLSTWPVHRNSSHRDRVLKVGFVSADFRAHSIAQCLQPLLAHLQHSEELKLFAYYNHHVEDDMTSTLKTYFSHWENIEAQPDQVVANLIQENGIDVLVDLSGHTAGNRLRLFAMKPAPIQVSWFGYLATTGLKAMDYYFADAFLAPAKRFDQYFSEKLVQLPVNANFVSPLKAPQINELPAIKNGFITFGSFNRPSKISDGTIELWAKLLKAMPTAKLLLGAMPPNDTNATFIAKFTRLGIDESRLIFHARSQLDDYLSLYSNVDICLDTQPSSGITPTFYAVWMGVPTLCLEANSVTGRGSMALMSHLKLTEFIAKDAQSFIQQAVFWSRNLDALSQLRGSMRKRFNDSTLADATVLSQALEVAFRKMWHVWCKRQSTRSFEVQL
jgi:predicted O-linked N-acetylglucosamine transferase (SPINDLY family)